MKLLFLLSLSFCLAIAHEGDTVTSATNEFINEFKNLQNWNEGKVEHYFDQNSEVFGVFMDDDDEPHQGVPEIWRYIKQLSSMKTIDSCTCDPPLVDNAMGTAVLNCDVSGKFQKTQKIFNNLHMHIYMRWDVATMKIMQFGVIPMDFPKLLNASLTTGEIMLFKMMNYPNWCQQSDEIQSKFFTPETVLALPNFLLLASPEKLEFKGQNALNQLCQVFDRIFEMDDQEGLTNRLQNFKVLFSDEKQVVYLYTAPYALTREGAELGDTVVFETNEFTTDGKLKKAEIVLSQPLMPWQVPASVNRYFFN